MRRGLADWLRSARAFWLRPVSPGWTVAGRSGARPVVGYARGGEAPHCCHIGDQSRFLSDVRLAQRAGVRRIQGRRRVLARSLDAVEPAPAAQRFPSQRSCSVACSGGILRCASGCCKLGAGMDRSARRKPLDMWKREQPCIRPDGVTWCVCVSTHPTTSGAMSGSRRSISRTSEPIRWPGTPRGLLLCAATFRTSREERRRCNGSATASRDTVRP